MPYALTGQTVPDEIISRDDKIGTFFLIINLFFPFWEGISYLVADILSPSDPGYYPALITVVVLVICVGVC